MITKLQLGVVGAFFSLFCNVVQAEEIVNVNVSWTTGYQTAAIKLMNGQEFHTITISSSKLPGEVSVVLDGNLCGLTETGKIAACTRMLPLKKKSLVRLYKKVPEGQLLDLLKGLRLMVENDSSLRLLVLDDQNEVVSAYYLKHEVDVERADVQATNP